MTGDIDHDATFADLLDPVPGPEPAGPSLRYGPVHAAIEEARKDEDADLPQGVWQRDVKRADDLQTIALCRAALATKSKDLLIACWLVEAAVRAGGFDAATAGLGFVSRLCETFWDGMHPQHDGESDSPRYGPVVWLDGALARLVRLAPVARGEREGKLVALSWSDYEQARRSEAAQRRAKAATKRDAAERLSIAAFDALADATPEGGLVAFRKALEATDAAAQALETVLTRLGGDTAPSMTALRRALREVGGLVGPILTRRRTTPSPVASKAAEASAAVPDSADAPNVPPPAANAALQAPLDRAQAYRALTDIAVLLRRIEPHSPTPYLIERAVRWGGMSLPEVLHDLPKEGRDPEMLTWLMGPRSEK